MSPGAIKRSRPAWALTCAVATTAVLTAGGLSSSAATASAKPNAEQTPAPSGSTAAMDPPATAPSPSPAASSASTERRVGRGIGDMMRSSASSSLFFKSIDRDGDGTVQPTELAGFVRQKIGGSAFDADDEVEAGVINAMATMDRDHDDGLDRSDVFAYWMKLESLLTADEVAEWVVYSVQLPESVGHIFKENVVTGYDFPELVENDGEALGNELGIERSSFRKKIVRHIHARMLGIGTVPTAPKNVAHKLESCSTASFSWAKSTAKGFPVHSYRVQRRAVDLYGDGTTARPAAKITNKTTSRHSQRKVEDGKDASVCRSSDENGFPLPSGDDLTLCKDTVAAPTASVELTDELPPAGATLSVPSASDWVTVYHGGEHDFVDAGLEYGHNYVYRIQAWNSVGRSEWTTVDISKSLRKQKCTTRPSTMSRSLPVDGSFYADDRAFYRNNATWPRSFLSGSYMVASFLIILIRAVFTLTAVAAAIMRFKRATAKSTTSAELEPVFPWLWKGINALSVQTTGIEVIPRSILGDKKSRKYESRAHDKEIKAVGLNGYNSVSDSFGEGDADLGEKGGDETRLNRRVMFRRTKSHSTGNLALLDSQKEITSTAAAPKILRKKRTKLDDEDAASPTAGAVAMASPKSVPRLRRPVRRSLSTGNEDIDGTTEERASSQESIVPPRSLFRKEASARTLSTHAASSLDEAEDDGSNDRLSERMALSDRLDYEDDHTRCNSCRKSYKFPKRFKHHCARCMSTFCHKHGRTTHSNLVSCRVPGNCVCNVCLELESFNSRGGMEDGGGQSTGTSARGTRRWKR